MITVEPLSQRDERWSKMLLGNSKRSTIGAYGCLLTCYAMLAGVDPPTMNTLRLRYGGFLNEPLGAYSSSPDISACAPHVRLLDISPTYYYPVPLEAMSLLCDQLSKPGNAAIIMVDPTPGIPGLQEDESHFVLAVDYSYGVIINDPWHGDRVKLSPRYGVRDEIAAYKWYTYEVRNV